MTYEENIQEDNNLISCGVDYERQGNYDCAIEQYKLAIEKFVQASQSNPEIRTSIVFAYLHIGNCYFAKNDLDSAIEAYNNALNKDVQTILSNPFFRSFIASAYNNRGNAFFHKKDYDKAKKDCKKAIEIQPEYSLPYIGLGFVYYAEKDFSLEAMKVYCKALEFVPNNSFIIGCFLESITHEKCNIGSDDKVLLQKSSSGLVSLVGDILHEIECSDCQKYICLIHAVYNLLEQLEQESPKETYYQYAKGDTFVKKTGEERSRSLWLTPACYQNDPKEGKSIFDFFYSRLKTESLESVFDGFRKENVVESGVPIAFIRSLSECKDDLVMWNSSYAGNGAGISIGIPFSKLEKAAKRPGYRHQENVDKLAELSIMDGGNKVSPSSVKKENNEDKKAVELMPIEELYFMRVLYLYSEEETEDSKRYSSQLDDITNALEKFQDYLKVKDNVKHFKKFIQRIFLPIAHLIKSADYKHEKEWRLIFYSPISKEVPFIQLDPLRIETEAFLFDPKGDREEIWLGPIFGKYLELEKMKIQHLFEYDGIADCVDIKLSDKRFRG